jgi:twitching motility protein PilT
MQKLQTIIQHAFKHKSAYVTVNTSAIGWEATGQEQTWSVPIDAAEWQALYDALFRNPENVAKGKIEIPNHGTILTMGVLEEKLFSLFMPGFESIYENEIQKRTAPPPPPPVMVPPPQESYEPMTQLSTKAFAETIPVNSLFEGDDDSKSTPGFDELFASETKQAPKQRAPVNPFAVVPNANEGFIPPIPENENVAEVKPLIALAEETVLPQGTPILTQRPKIELSMDALDASLFADPVQSVPTSAPVKQVEAHAPNPPIEAFVPDEPLVVSELEPSADLFAVQPPQGAAVPASAADPVETIKSHPTSVQPPPIDPALTIQNPPIDKYLRLMLDRKASDLHFTSGQPIAFRIDGEIEREKEPVLSEESVMDLFKAITPRKNWEEFSTISDTDFAYEIKGLARYRVNLFRDRHGMGAVLRHIPNDILTLQQLGLPSVVKRFCELNKGLVVVTGPTGSGKSTTLAAMVDYVNQTRKDHILTLEDPIEFVHQQKGCLIRQREIHKHTESFSRALRAALREDPDIILVGELRDLETTAMAIEIAETGHLVFATLHTTTAVGTIDRVIDQFPSDQQEQIRTMLSESLRGVVSQTLLKKIGGGRVAAQEILVVNPAVSSLIREGKTHMIANHMQSQKADGNQILTDVLASLVERGLVDPREAYNKSVKKGELLVKFKAMGIPFELAA